MAEDKKKEEQQEKKPKKDTQSRKYLLTINNPKDYDMSHDQIKEKLKELKSCVYWCMCDEIGLETKTHHTHLFIALRSSVYWSRIKKLFPHGGIESCKGTAQQNRDYIRKEGKYQDSEKKETNLPETFEEWGEMPIEKQGKRNDLAMLYEMISQGMSNYEIISTETKFLFDVEKIERARKVIKEEEYKNKWRDVEVHYIYGETGQGKTRYVMEKYGYQNVCKITDYNKNPFDDYSGQPVLLLDDYRSNFKLRDMLNYLDGYPLNLPARYVNRVACYTSVYITSNISLQEQHLKIQKEEPKSWYAFLRRIKDVTYYGKNGNKYTYEIDKNSFYLKSTNEIIREIEKNNSAASHQNDEQLTAEDLNNCVAISDGIPLSFL